MTTRSAGPRRRPSIRLLFDENLPWRVAAALRQLGFHSAFVGDEERGGTPGRSSSDEEVLDFAQRTNQVVVTSNHDMILLSAERGQSVIWIDPRGRQLRLEDHVLLVFKNISDWDARFRDAEGPMCLRAMRTKTDTLTLDEAGRLARQRMRRISAALKRKKSQTPLGPLPFAEGDPVEDPSAPNQ